MRKIKQQLVIAVLLVNFTIFAQTENVFHDRSFWNSDINLVTVKQKIEAGNDPTAFNSNAFDATVNAILGKANDDVIKYLLSIEGNPVDKKTHDSRTYLHWAAYAGKTEIVKTLLEQGADVTVLDSHGNTPLTFAAGAGQMNTEIYDLFIKHGVDLTQETNEYGANVLLLVAPSMQDENDLAYFINKGIDITSTDHDANGIFNYAAKKGNIDFLKVLVDQGVDYKTLNKEGGNAFLFAAQGGRGYSNTIEVYEYLKTLGLEPNVVTHTGYTPLHRLAYSNTDPKIFKFFLNAGADVNQQDAEGNTPFLNAASRNKLEVAEFLADQIDDINATNQEGQTALMLAVERNSPEVITFLINQKSDVWAKDSEGNTLAYYLIQSYNTRRPGDFDAKLQLLQDTKLPLNTVQANGNTLYHLAAKENDLELFKKIEGLNIPINTKNQEGLTALHIAAMKAKNQEILKYLIARGADSTIKTDFEETVYDLANENELLQKENTSLKFLK